MLKRGGEFVVTFPSDKEGLKLGYKLLTDNIRSNLALGKNKIMTFLELLAQIIAGIVYLPLLFRPTNQGRYSSNELKAMIAKLKAEIISIEEDNIYQDFIIYGKKI